MARLVLFSLLCLAVVGSSLAKIFGSPCDIARALKGQNFPSNEIPDWVCLVQAESSGNTAAVGPPNTDGSQDYGLFQINSRYWCGLGNPGGGCGVTCQSLTDDDISNDSDCAKKIKGVQGLSAWTGWTRKCKGQKLPDVGNC